MTEEHWDRAFDNKLRGTVRCIRHAVPPMRERKWGRIVNISGGAAWTPQIGAITTGMNNAAVQNLTVALANELGKDGILVNAIVPTAIRTERHDQNIRDAMAKTGQSEAEVLKPRVAKVPLGPDGQVRGDRRGGRVPAPPNGRVSSPAAPGRWMAACRQTVISRQTQDRGVIRRETVLRRLCSRN